MQLGKSATMNIKITSVTNPFSFYCKIENDVCPSGPNLDNVQNDDYSFNYKNDISDFNHGQYVAVLWENKWTRGVISMESQFLIWLVDYGFYLRPDDKTVFINLPADYKSFPTKIFEASIHGVTPVDKVIQDFLEVTIEHTNVWNPGAIQKSKELIKSATQTYLVPVAILSTKQNDVVLGDLYLQIPNRGIVNLSDELSLWPVFLEKNKAAYIQNMTIFYNNHRKHRASTLLKPQFDEVEIPTISLGITLEEYNALCENVPPFEDPADNISEASTNVSTCTIFHANCNKKSKKRPPIYKLSVEEMEKYADMYVNIYDRKYNVLHILVTKLADLNMCERCKDYDLKSVGRANRHRGVNRGMSDLNFDQDNEGM